MAFQEFPKALYRDGEYAAVDDATEEEAHRADGWTDWAEDHARMNAAASDSATPAPTPKRAPKKA